MNENENDVKKSVLNQTQGEVKILRYIEDLIRNEAFQKKLKKSRRTAPKKWDQHSWTKDENAERDRLDDEITEIVKVFEKLKKRCNKIIRDKYFVKQEDIAATYGLDSHLQQLAFALMENDNETAEMLRMRFGERDMCFVLNDCDEELWSMNAGSDFVHLRPQRQLQLIASPVAVYIHPRASKNDVLDFIEKRWGWIEANFLRTMVGQEALRTRKRKYDRDTLDFLWKNRKLKPKEIKVLLNQKFPKNTLIYSEIQKLLKYESLKRKRKLS